MINKEDYIEYAKMAKNLRVNKIDYNLELTRGIRTLFNDYKKHNINRLKEIGEELKKVNVDRFQLKEDARKIYGELLDAGHVFDVFEVYCAESSLHEAIDVCKRGAIKPWISQMDDGARRHQCFVVFGSDYAPEDIACNAYHFENIDQALSDLGKLDKHYADIRNERDEAEAELQLKMKERNDIYNKAFLGIFLKKSAKEKIVELDYAIDRLMRKIRKCNGLLDFKERDLGLEDIKKAISLYGRLDNEERLKFNKMIANCNMADGTLYEKWDKANKEFFEIQMNNSANGLAAFIKNSPKKSEYKQYIKNFLKYLSENKINTKLSNGKPFDVFEFVDFGRYKNEVKCLFKIIELKKQNAQNKKMIKNKPFGVFLAGGGVKTNEQTTKDD